MILFNQRSTNDYFEGIANNIVRKIDSLDDDDIVNYNQAFVEKLISEYKINTSFSINDLKDYNLEMYPSDETFSIRTGKLRVAIVFYEYNIEGNSYLLNLKPSSSINILTEVQLTNSSLKFYINSHNNDLNITDQQLVLIKNQRDSLITNIKNNINKVISDCEKFNNILEVNIINLLEKRKEKIIQHRAMKEKLR